MTVVEGKQFVAKVLVHGKTVTVPLSGKGIRKALAAIREHGTDDIFVSVTGKLNLATLTLEEAGILAQLKVKKETQAGSTESQSQSVAT